MKKKLTRNTLPKAIAAACKSGDRNKAMDLAVFGRKATALTNLARDLYWLCRVQHPKLKKAAMSGGGERHGWEQPLRQTAKEITQRFERWKNYKVKELLARIQRGGAWYGKRFEADLKREYNRVHREDATALLFCPPSNKKSAANNPNWFRQILIANQGLVKIQKWDKHSGTLTNKTPKPLYRIAVEYEIAVRTLRREARKMGVKPGKAGTPLRRKAPPLI
jgi:hypothetical protein